MAERAFHLEPRAAQDLREQFDYIAQDSLGAAIRYLDAANAAFEQLSSMPRLGARQTFPSPRLVGIRRWAVPGFRNYLIFYQEGSTGITVLRVLHGARDIAPLLLEEDEGSQ